MSIKSALKTYDKSKGLWRRIFGDAPAIKALRRLSSAEQDDLLKVYQCFLDAPPTPSQASYQVYQAVMKQLGPLRLYNTSIPAQWFRMFEAALVEYDKNKGFFRRIFGDAAAIRAIRRLPAKDRLDPANIAKCFIEHDAAPDYRESSKVFRQFSNYFFLNPYSSLTTSEKREFFLMLNEAKLLTQENLYLIRYHLSRNRYPHKRVQEIIDLNRANLLTQEALSLVAGSYDDPSPFFKAFLALDGAGQLMTPENLTLIARHGDSLSLVRGVLNLSAANLLTQENLNLIARHKDPRKLAEAFLVLNEAKLLTPENKPLIARHDYPYEIAKAFLMLNKANLLTQENKLLIARQRDPRKLAEAFLVLNTVNLLTQENLNLIARHDYPYEIAEAFLMLNKANLLTQENKPLITRYEGGFIFLNLPKVFGELNKANLLTQENYDILVQQGNPWELHCALLRLSKVNLLTQENFDILAQHDDDSRDLAEAFVVLNKVNLLTPENKLLIARHDDTCNLARAFSVLNDADLLTQRNFNQLLQHDHYYLISAGAGRTVWNRLPIHLFTQPVFNRLLECARADDPVGETGRYIDRLLGIRQANNAREVEVNAPQSTHTASVHKSVSESAKKLLQRYGERLQEAFSSIAGSMRKFIDSASNPPLQKEAAKRAATRIIESGDAFKDPESNVSNKQLLALSYLAVHDEEKRTGALEDAQKQVVEGLYEIQRGYNLSATGVDDGRQDRPICTGGTFNKMMEKLQGIHPDVEIVFVDKGLASKKLQVVAREEAQKHLEQQPDASLVDQVKEECSLEPIWEAIEPSVLTRMYDEFHTLFPNGKNGDFEDFAGNGKWVALSDEDVNKIKSTIEKPPAPEKDSATQLNGSSSQGLFTPPAKEEVEQEIPSIKKDKR